jgi:hypothetical protein
MLQSLLQFLISMQLIPLLKGGCDLPELAMAEMGKSANQLGLVNIAMFDYQRVVRVSSSYISSGKTHKFNGKNVCSF